MDFWREIWAFACTLAPTLPKKLAHDIYDIGWRMQREGGSWHSQLCWCAKDIAKHMKARLPDNLHNRMVLGEQNRHTAEYLKKWGV